MSLEPPAKSAGILVRKYGGSSLASVERLRQVAHDIASWRAAGHSLVVVVSAMGQTTDELDRLARQTNPNPPRRELDMLLSVGERITMSLLSMALAAEGCSAISYTGSQCGIITDSSHTDARIIEVKADRVRQSLAEGHVVVVAGFQGVSRAKEITTLGRGGSDTTAVALAAALGAARCEILKDVSGVMTADPHKVAGAHRYDMLSYDQLRQLAAAGCGVLHVRAIDYAEQHGVTITIGSSFQDGPGTLVQGPRPSPAADPLADPSTYQPLGMTVREDVAWLEVAAAEPNRVRALLDRLARSLPAIPVLAEWLEVAGGLRWGAVAAPETLAPVHDHLAGLATANGWQLVWRRGFALITLAGGPPVSWVLAERRLVPLLERLGISSWRVRAEESCLRLLVPAGSLALLLEPLHAEFFPGRTPAAGSPATRPV